MNRPNFIARREHYGWLIFNIKSRQIQRGNAGNVQKLIQQGASVRVITNSLVPGALSAPIKVFLDITNHCNLQCIHCLSSSQPQSRTHLSFDIIQAVVNECRESGVFMIKIGGGEPLLRKDIWDIVHFIWSQGMAISMSTNGTILTEQIITNLRRFDVDISVSIDGDEATHNAIRGEGVYQKAIRTLQRFKSSGINPSIRFTMMNINIRTVPHVVRLARSLDLRLKVRRLKPRGRAVKNDLIINSPTKEYLEALDILNATEKCEIEDIMNFQGSIRSHLLLGPNDCGAGTRSVHINFNGDVSPCIFLGPDFVDGNIQQTSLMDIWRNGVKMQILRNLPLNDQCSMCDRKFTCHAECPAIRLYLTGSLHGDDPGCLNVLRRLK